MTLIFKIFSCRGYCKIFPFSDLLCFYPCFCRGYCKSMIHWKLTPFDYTLKIVLTWHNYSTYSILLPKISPCYIFHLWILYNTDTSIIKPSVSVALSRVTQYPMYFLAFALCWCFMSVSPFLCLCILVDIPFIDLFNNLACHIIDKVLMCFD